jgi:Na+/H+-dicarboxylate symporter
MIGRYIALSVLYTGLGLVFFTIIFNIHIGQPPKGENEVMKIFNMVFNILPDNPVKPFIDLNTLQIAVIGIFVGLLILSNGERLGNIKNAFQGGNILMSDAIYVICKLLPLYILSSLSLLFWQDGYSLLLKLWKPILFTAIFVFLLVVIATLYSSMRLKVSPLLIAKKLLPGSLIGLSTASSMAAFSAVFESCEKKLGIASKLAKVGIPLGHIGFVAPFSFIFAIPSLYIASSYCMEVDLIWLVILGILSVLISMSIPPVPGTFLACLTIVFSQLKIPVEGISISATLGMLLDFVLTGGRVYLNQVELLLQAKSYDMLDMDVLKKENV